MAESTLFDKKNIQRINPERKEDLLDQLDLPPKLSKFIRDNGRELKIALVVFLVLFLGWTFWGQYSERKINQASDALTEAMREADDGKRLALLSQVDQDFSGSNAALLALLETGHIEFQNGNFEKSAGIFQKVAAGLPSESPLVPLLDYYLGLSYENMNELDKAYDHYQGLASLDGFELLAKMALGRVLAAQGKSSEALETYQAVLAMAGVSPQQKSILTEKINNLQDDSADN